MQDQAIASDGPLADVLQDDDAPTHVACSPLHVLASASLKQPLRTASTQESNEPTPQRRRLSSEDENKARARSSAPARPVTRSQPQSPFAVLLGRAVYVPQRPRSVLPEAGPRKHIEQEAPRTHMGRKTQAKAQRNQRYAVALQVQEEKQAEAQRQQEACLRQTCLSDSFDGRSQACREGRPSRSDHAACAVGTPSSGSLRSALDHSAHVPSHAETGVGTAECKAQPLRCLDTHAGLVAGVARPPLRSVQPAQRSSPGVGSQCPLAAADANDQLAFADMAAQPCVGIVGNVLANLRRSDKPLSPEPLQPNWSRNLLDGLPSAQPSLRKDLLSGLTQVQ